MSKAITGPQVNGQEATGLLQQDLESAIGEGLCVVAIIDPASFATAWSKFGAVALSCGGGSLFAGSPQAQDPAVAPLLVPLHRTDETTRRAIAEIALHSPAVVWLASDLPLFELLPALSAKLRAELAEGRQLITLRFFDPRVLPELLRVMDDRQRTHLNRGIRRWWWLDRRNGMRRDDPVSTTPSAIPPMDACIALSDEQVQTLLEASFVDRVLDVLARSAPDCLRPFDRAQKQDIAARHIEAAASWGLSSEYDCASYIAVSLQQGPAFACSPSWAVPMNAVKSGMLKFSDAIEQWEASHDSSA